MRALVQRVSRARVVVEGEEVGAIGPGLLVFVGVSEGDGEKEVAWLARKLTGLRIFADAEGKMNLSVKDTGGQALLVSQFTLCADVSRGTRPSFAKAMEPGAARALFERVVAEVGKEVPVATGRFGAHMEVELVNDGPVTLWLDTNRSDADRSDAGRSDAGRSDADRSDAGRSDAHANRQTPEAS